MKRLKSFQENGVSFRLILGMFPDANGKLVRKHLLSQSRKGKDKNGKVCRIVSRQFISQADASLILAELNGKEVRPAADKRNVKGSPNMRTRSLTIEDDGNEGEDWFQVSGGIIVGTLKPGSKNRENLFSYCRKNGVVATATDESETAFTLSSDSETLGKLWDMPFFASVTIPIAVRIPFTSAGSGTFTPAAEKRHKEYMRPMDNGFVRKADFEAVKEERKRLGRIVVTKEESPHFESNKAVDRFRAEESERSAFAKSAADNEAAAVAKAEFEAKRNAVAVADATEFLRVAIAGGLLQSGTQAQSAAMLGILTQWYLVNDSAPDSLQTLAAFARSL